MLNSSQTASSGTPAPKTDNFERRLRIGMVTLYALAAATTLLARGASPFTSSVDLAPLTSVAVAELQPPNVSELRAEDAALALLPGPVRFAEPIALIASPQSSGSWQTLPSGDRVWRLRIDASGATELNFGFTRYELPAGAELYVYSVAHKYYEGPYTADDNEEHGQLWTPVLPGDEAVIELRVPSSVEFEPVLQLGQVGYGYRNMFFGDGDDGSQNAAGACNNDVACQLADSWRDEIRSVAAFGVNGSLFCTGTLVADVPGSCKPFFLTADHCGIDASNAASMVVYWNYQTTSCGGSRNGQLSDNQTGAYFRASHFDSDFTLVELDDPPSAASDVYYSGWDARSVTPSGGVGIHHPDTQEKAISFSQNPLSSADSCISGASQTHWQVNGWNDGTTEPGSSGSGLWDPLTRLVVGTLSGGSARCPDNTGTDCYGKLSVHYAIGNTSSGRLRDWLDPQSTGQQFAPPSNCNGESCAHDLCSTGGQLDPGCNSCVASVCADDPTCCSLTWDATCASKAQALGCCGGAPTSESCDNGTDDDNDGLTDCNDPDCASDSACIGGGGNCVHAACTEGIALVASCDGCVADICAADPYCCSVAWDNVCVDAAQSASCCGGQAAEICGNGSDDDGDGAVDCNDSDCAADPTCSTGNSCAHPACTEGIALDASCNGCVADICAADPYCCSVAWDNACVDAAQSASCCGGQASEICGNGSDDDGDGAVDCNDTDCSASPACGASNSCSHSTCNEGSALDADCDGCVTTVCAADPYCCNVAWDNICVDQAVTYGCCTAPVQLKSTLDDALARRQAYASARSGRTGQSRSPVLSSQPTPRITGSRHER